MNDAETLAPAPAAFVPYSDEPPKNQVNPLVRLHLLLYGRYRWAVILGIILSVGGALAAWFAMPPKYQVIGYVNIKPYVPPVLNVTDQNGMLPMFETFVSLQVSLLQSQRVLDQASTTPEWKALRMKSPRWGDRINPDNLVVDHPKASELVSVAYTDPNPDVAATAVKAILQTYQTTSGDVDDASAAQRSQVLEQLRNNLNSQKRDINNRILEVANPFGTDDLSELYQLKFQWQNSLESELERIATEITLMQANSGDGPANQALNNVASSTQPAKAAASTIQGPGVPLSVQDVAKIDSQMRDFLSQESALTLRLNQLRLRFGDSHPQVLAARTDLQALDDQINKLLAVYQSRPIQTVRPSPALGAGASTGLSLTELRTRQANVQALFKRVKEEATDIGQTNLKIRSLKEDRDAIDQKLEQTSSRIDQLNLEAKMSNRISVLSLGERPNGPVPDKRIPLTVALGLLGLAAGPGLVGLRGLADRRVRCLLQMEQVAPSIPVLGVLPVLPDDFSDPDQVSLTARCVHQIRNLLDVGQTHEVGRVIAITSPSPGDGKTSLSLALGMSFAVSGSRTLLIDCDMIGCGLTSRLNVVVPRRMRSILLRQRLVNQEQVDNAIRVAAVEHKKLAETLVSLGYVSAEDIQRARAAQKNTSVGLLDALNGEPLVGCVAPAVVNDLFILPMGKADPENAHQISLRALRRIIEDARNRYDMILIDTGPILGSVEASVAARVADEVILAISRGVPSPMVARVAELLHSLGARLGGAVFNRATPGDLAYSKYGSSGSLRSLSSGGLQNRSNGEPGADAGGPPRLGPVASAMASAGDRPAIHASIDLQPAVYATAAAVTSGDSIAPPSPEHHSGESHSAEEPNNL